VHGRLRLGPSWVSHVLQDLAVDLWHNETATELLQQAETAYTVNRTRLCAALADHGLAAAGRTGLNVWIPVPDETVATTRLFTAGWAAAPGTRFRIASVPAIRVTIADMDVTEIGPLADAVADAVQTTGRATV
jgi:DNA-binding transcriptional MocR family regulator